MKKTIIFLLAAALVALAAGLGACNPDLLDIQQRGVISTENYYKTDEEAKSSVAYLYRLWKQQLYTGAPLFDHMTPDSYAGGGIRGDNVQYEQENEFRYTTENTNISGYFTRLYNMIYGANIILENYSDDSPEKLRVKAEAKFFRAWANFQLVTLWGTPYYVDRVLTSPAEYNTPNAESPQVFWTSIEDDLNAAIGSGQLPSKSSLEDRVTGGRVTLEAAKAYLGRAYLWQKKYPQAVSALQSVIDSDRYALVDDPSVLFHSEGDHSVEYLAEAESLDDPVNWSQQAGLSGMAFAWKVSNSIVLNKNKEEWPYQTVGGYGFTNPTGSFVELVRGIEGEDGKRFKNYFVTWDHMVERYGATATRNHFFNEGWFQTKMLTRKGDDFQSVSSSGWFYTHMNWPHMRYAEVLLMAAEAYLHDGNMAKAVEYFNMIRSRAGAPTVTTLDIETILVERRVELWLESPVIFQDIQRYRLGEQLCGNQFVKYPVYTLIGDYAENPELIWHDNGFDYGFKEKHYLMPYSSGELLSNPNLVQNPGW